MSESKSLDQLNANPANPRTMSRGDAEALKRSMNEFGDLSSIVFNTITEQLVGGHQRTNIMKTTNLQSSVQITQRFDPATDDGTTAIGYVVFNGKQFPYREVAWELDRETAANIAANKIQGDFDDQLLAEALFMLQENSPDLIGLTGVDDDELKKLMKSVGVGDDDAPAEDEEEKEPRLAFKISAEQKAMIQRTIAHVKDQHNLTGKDEEVINGKAIIMFVEAYLELHPVQEQSFEPPEIPSA